MLVAAFGCAPVAAADESAEPRDAYAAAVKSFEGADWNEAAMLFREALETDGDDPRAEPARLYLAEALFRSQRAAEAAYLT